MPLITLALFSSTLALALGFGMPGMGDMAQSSDGKDMEKILYPCFRDAACGVLGDPAEKEMAKCMNGLTPRDVDEILKSLEGLGYKDIGTKELPKVCRYFCPKEEEEKKSTFKKAVQEFVDYLNTACSDDPEGCEETNAALKCVMNRINQHQAKAECKPEE